MAEPLMDTTMMVMIGGTVAIIVVIYFLVTKRTGKKFKDFVPDLFGDTVNKELKNRMNLHGKKIKKGKLLQGFQTLGNIDKYYSTKGDMPVAYYDQDTQDYKQVLDKEGNEQIIEYDFSVFRIKSKVLLFRWLGLKKSYMIMRNADDESKSLISIDHKTGRIFVPKNVEFDSYGNVWNECQTAKDYLNNISFMEMMQQMQTHLQNIPNRTVHLEVEQAKKERLYERLAQIEKSKYDQMKRGDETVIS